MKKVVLIDGHSILNRAFYGVPDLTNNEGLHTNAVFGFLNILFKVIEDEKPDNITVAFDLKEPTFRHKLYDAYKGTRKPAPEEFRQQVPLIKEVLSAMGICIVSKAGYEADDILGTLAKSYERDGYKVSILSGDRDMLQLASDNITIRIPKTKGGNKEVEDYSALDVFAKYGVTPEEFISVKALMGDTSDNIPGAAGIGEKTATKLVAQYHTIDNIYANIDNIGGNKAKNALIESKEMVELSFVLARIDTNVPLDDYSVEAAKLTNLFTKEAYEQFVRFEFKSFLKKFDDNVTTDMQLDLNDRIVRIDDFAIVEDIFARFSKAKKLAFELLTNNGLIDGIVLIDETDKIYYIPVWGFVSGDYLLAKLTELLNNDNILICTSNLKEQLKFINPENSPLIYDVSLMAYLLNPLKESYTYMELALEFAGINHKSANDDIYEAICKAYTAFAVVEVLNEKLEQTDMLKLYKEIELPLVYVLYNMEKYGIKVNKEELEAFGQKLQEKIKVVEQRIYDAIGEEFNINSPKQLGVILFEKMGLPGMKKTKSGYSTSAEVLEKLAPDYPVVRDILEYRQLTKLNSTYVEGLVGYIREDKRIHGKFNQTITATGRISSTEPNLQNIPVRMELGREIRKVFVPEDDYVFIDADYSQIELRILAHMSLDDVLIEAYSQHSDIHRSTASKVFNVPLEEVTDLQRRNAKAVNFGIVYGISSFGLSNDLSISKKEAQSYIEEYFKTYSKVKVFLDKCVSDAKEKGYVTTMYNRRRPVPEITSSNFMQRAFGERIAMNSPIQGTAADIIKLAMIRVSEALKKNNMRSRLILQVHDELLIETHKDEIDAVKDILNNEMKNVADLSVSLEIDVCQGNSWYEAK